MTTPLPLHSTVVLSMPRNSLQRQIDVIGWANFWEKVPNIPANFNMQLHCSYYPSFVDARRNSFFFLSSHFWDSGQLTVAWVCLHIVWNVSILHVETGQELSFKFFNNTNILGRRGRVEVIGRGWGECTHPVKLAQAWVVVFPFGLQVEARGWSKRTESRLCEDEETRKTNSVDIITGSLSPRLSQTQTNIHFARMFWLLRVKLFNSSLQ